MSRLVLRLGCLPLFIALFMLITITLSPIVWGIVILSTRATSGRHHEHRIGGHPTTGLR